MAVRTRSNGIVISRNIMNGIEVVFDNCERAANYCNFSPASFRQTYLNQARQLNGKHWRSEGRQYWIPPIGLRFDAYKAESTYKGYIKAINVNSNEVVIFESITAASKHFKLNRQTLSYCVKHIKIYFGYQWSILHMSKWGTWVDSDEIQEIFHSVPINSTIVE